MPEKSSTPVDRRAFLARATPMAAAGVVVAGGLGMAGAATQPQAAPRGELLVASREAMNCRFAALFPQQFGHEGVETASRALDHVDRLERRLSIFHEESEVSFVNNWAARTRVGVSKELAGLLERSRRLYDETGGAFDVAAGRLVRLWKAYLQDNRVPGSRAVEQALQLGGMRHVQLRNRSVRFLQPGVRLDFGGNGKGYALDCAWDEIRRLGLCDVLLHAGHSSMLAHGRPPWDEGWRVNVVHPLDEQRSLARLCLYDTAMATSANDLRGPVIDGKRCGHLIDPRNGWPVRETVGVTVVAPTAEEADALSTAFFMLGSEETRAYCAKRSDIGALLVPAAENGKQPEPVVIGRMNEFVKEVSA